MQFYKMLSKHYTEIFPLSKAVVKVTKENTPDAGRILDVGSAKGELVYALASDGYDAVGVEYVPELIGCSERTVVGDMHSLEFEGNSFDTVVCMGNTLVHSDNPEKVISEFARVLKKGGKVIIQILNYDRILSKKPASLPSITTENVVFDRLYDYDAESIKFTGVLKSEGQTESSSVTLYPAKHGDMLEILCSCGFSDIQCYGGFDMSEFSKTDSFPLVLIAVKV